MCLSPDVSSIAFRLFTISILKRCNKKRIGEAAQLLLLVPRKVNIMHTLHSAHSSKYIRGKCIFIESSFQGDEGERKQSAKRREKEKEKKHKMNLDVHICNSALLYRNRVQWSGAGQHFNLFNSLILLIILHESNVPLNVQRIMINLHISAINHRAFIPPNKPPRIRGKGIINNLLLVQSMQRIQFSHIALDRNC